MDLLFTTNSRIPSRIIRWGRGHDISHMAFAFVTSLGENSFVVHSKLFTGVHVTIDFFESDVEVVKRLRFKSDASEYDLFKGLWNQTKSRDYDYKAIVWLGLTTLLSKAIPYLKVTRNQWQDKKAFYCNEMIKPLKAEFQKAGVDFDGVDLANLYPQEAYEFLSKFDCFEEVA